MEFGAKPDKQLRRKLLSSKLEMDSCVVVFDNGELVGERLRGGFNWKAGLHRGVGSVFSKVYLDSESVPRILQALSVPFDSGDIRTLIFHLLSEIEKGIPKLADGWFEFPGYANGLTGYKKLIGRKRLEIPSLTLFQKAFTSEIKAIDDFVGPIDFFDGLDALMLSAFFDSRFSSMRPRLIHVSKLKDEDAYPNRIDPRMLHTIENVEIPLVSLAAGLMCVRTLRKMYDTDENARDSHYHLSLRKADDSIVKWLDR
jgi:hypothetical protein